jgi:hypothetical protein
MPETAAYTVAGLTELETLLKNFPGKLGTTVVRRALADAAKLGKDALKAEALKHDGRGAIRVNMRTLKSRVRHLSDEALSVARHYANGQEYIAVGFQWPEGAAGWIVEHGHRMVTGGTVVRIRGAQGGQSPKAKRPGLTGAGRVIGFVQPHPIAAPAFEEVRPAMEQVFTDRVVREAESEFKF